MDFFTQSVIEIKGNYNICFQEGSSMSLKVKALAFFKNAVMIRVFGSLSSAIRLILCCAGGFAIGIETIS
mgnify:CR=1 FL=1